MTPKSAHTNLIRALTALTPSRIAGSADASDVQNRVDHLRAVWSVFTRYLDAIVADTAGHIAGEIDLDRVDLILFDSMADDDDIMGALERAGCHLVRGAELRRCA